MKPCLVVLCFGLLLVSSPRIARAGDCLAPLDNPSFEAATIPGITQYDQIPGWTLSGGMTAIVYGSAGSLTGAPASEDNWGSTYLDGGFSSEAVATQRIVVPQDCEAIYDQNFYYLRVEARLGDVAGEPDHAGIEVRFFDATDQPLGNPVQVVSEPGGAGNSIIYIYFGSQPIPPGTRVVEVKVLLENLNGGRNTAWTDNLLAALIYPDPVMPTTWGAIKTRFGE